jgi:outer membrane protein OmpA-like peptidoglycan-associated protein
MAAVGRGERELRVPTMDNVENPLNRRVEVLVR